MRIAHQSMWITKLEALVILLIVTAIIITITTTRVTMEIKVAIIKAITITQVANSLVIIIIQVATIHLFLVQSHYQGRHGRVSQILLRKTIWLMNKRNESPTNDWQHKPHLRSILERNRMLRGKVRINRKILLDRLIISSNRLRRITNFKN